MTANTTKRRLTDEQLATVAALRRSGIPWADITARFGCHEQTIKKELHRSGVMTFHGNKYEPPATSVPKTSMWERPCTVCGTTNPRPKWQYRCDPCKARLENGLPDESHLSVAF